MGKFLLFWFLLVLQQNVFSQAPFNKAYHNKKEFTSPFLIVINGDYYFATLDQEGNTWGNCYLYRHSDNGALKSRTVFPSLMYPSGAIKTKDNKLLLMGRDLICDTQGEFQANIFSKIDTNGTLVFTFSFLTEVFDNVKALLQYNDSSYYAFTDSVLFIHNKTGQFISSTNFGLNSISSALLLQNNNILLSARQGTASALVTVSPAGIIQNVKPFPELLTKLVFYNGQKIMGSGANGSLYKISPGFDMIASSPFPSAFGITDFICDNDTVYSILTSSAVTSGYAVSDSSLNTITLSNTSTQGIYQLALSKNNSRIGIISHCVSDTADLPSSNCFASLSSINKLTGNNFSSDIGLCSVVADSIYFPNPYTCFLRARVKIKNKGAKAITSFKLNCLAELRIDCNVYYYQQLFTGQLILPGDSAIVTTDFIKKNPIYLGNSAIYCLFSTLPNGETDRTLYDNELCVDFSSILASYKEQTTGNNLNIFPNPFGKALKVESGNVIKKLELYNATGTFMKEINVAAKQVLLDHLDLPNGMYLLKIETEKGITIKKVVKD